MRTCLGVVFFVGVINPSSSARFFGIKKRQPTAIFF